MTDYSTEASTIKTALDAVYAKKTSLPTKTSDLTNDGDGTNAFLTQHQSLTDYVQKSNGANTMTDSSAYSTIGTSANATQKQINAKIDEKLDDIYNTFLREIISISASRPYLLSGEKTDLIVTLHNGVGTPLANKSVTVSDGTSVYSGITNNQGIFTLFNVGISATTTYTVTYGTETATTNVYLCQFVDYGTTSNYTNWDIVASTMQMTRQDTYTELKRKTDASSFGYIVKNLSVTDGITIEFDFKQATTPSSNDQYLSFRDSQGNSKLGINRNYQSLNDGEWHHYKLVVNGLTITPVIDGVQKSNLTLSGSWSRLQLEARNNAVQHFKNFVVY